MINNLVRKIVNFENMQFLTGKMRSICKNAQKPDIFLINWLLSALIKHGIYRKENKFRDIFMDFGHNFKTETRIHVRKIVILP